MAKRRGSTWDGNSEVVAVTVRRIVGDRQFQAGYRDRLAGRPPPPFYYDSRVKGGEWEYERGRMVACWLLATGRRPPGVRDIRALVDAYLDARDADAVR